MTGFQFLVLAATVCFRRNRRAAFANPWGFWRLGRMAGFSLQESVASEIRIFSLNTRIRLKAAVRPNRQKPHGLAKAALRFRRKQTFIFDTEISGAVIQR
jgi:hypothetical protein